MLFVIASCSSTGDFSNPYGKAHEVQDGPSSQAGRCCWGVAQKPEQSFRNGRLFFFFLWVFEVLFCGFSYFPPQVRFWITWSLRLVVGLGSKFFGAADPSFICESTQAFER